MNFYIFVQLGQGSVNLTFQEKEIFIWSFVKNENKKEEKKKIGKYQFTCTTLVNGS